MSKLLSITAFLTVFCASFSLRAMERAPEKRSITPENLASLLPAMSSEQQEAADAWLDKYGKVLLTCNAITTFKSWRDDLNKKNELLTSNGLTNKDNPNWGDIIVDMNDHQEAELAGMVNRRQNLIQHHGQMGKSDSFSIRFGALGAPQTSNNPEAFKALYEELTSFHNEQFAHYQKNPVPTYQNMSNAAHAVLLYDAKDKHNLHAVHIPRINAVPFDSQNVDKSASDDTHCIIRERVHGAYPAQSQDFTPEIARQLYVACKYAYLYSLDDPTKILVREDGSVALNWIKQPNATDVTEFFLNDIEKSKMRSIFAMQNLVTRVKGNKEAAEALKAHIAHDLPYLKTCMFHENLLKDAEITK